jgi:hypothetical protein
VEVGTNFSDGTRVLARIGDNQQMVIPIPIIFLFLKQRIAMVLTHLVYYFDRDATAKMHMARKGFCDRKVPVCKLVKRLKICQSRP